MAHNPGWRFAATALLITALASTAAAQSHTVLANEQEDPSSRAGRLYALVMLRIAPYVTAEAPGEARRGDEAAPPRGTGTKDDRREPAPGKDPKNPPKNDPEPKPEPKPRPDPKPDPKPEPKPETDDPPRPTHEKPGPQPSPGKKPATENQPARDRGSNEGEPRTGTDKPGREAKNRPGPGAAVPPPRPYRIGLVGHDDVTTAAPRHVTGLKVGERPTATVAVTPEAAVTPPEQLGYDLLYIGDSVPAETVRQILRSHARRPIPLVSTQTGFAAAGGGVQLFVQDNVVRFEVNADALRKQGVHVDSQLQKLSRKGPVPR